MQFVIATVELEIEFTFFILNITFIKKPGATIGKIIGRNVSGKLALSSIIISSQIGIEKRIDKNIDFGINVFI